MLCMIRGSAARGGNGCNWGKRLQREAEEDSGVDRQIKVRKGQNRND